MSNFSPKAATIFLCMLFTASLTAQSNDSAQTEKLYESAVSKISALGIPSVKGAQYVKLSQFRGSYSSYGGDEKEVLQGNGFITKKDADGKSFFISLQGDVIEIGGKKNSANRYERSYDFSKAEDVDLKKDLEGQIKQLNTPSFRKQIIERMEYSPETVVKYFLVGCLAYDCGETEVGVKMLKGVLNISDSSVILNILISKLADAKLATAFQDFNKHKDWAQYEEAVELLCKQYARGWKSYPAAQLLIENIKVSAQQGELKVPVIEGVEYKPDVVKKVLKLLGAKNAYPYDAWLLQSRQEGQFGGNGMDAFIVMAALLDVNQLIKTTNNNGYNSYSSHNFHGGDEDIESLYKSLPKPQNVGDVFAQWVRGAVPTLDSRQELGGAELKAVAIEWWKENKDKSKIEMVTAMLEGAEQHNISSLLQVLLNDKSRESRDLVEKYVLEAESPSDMSYIEPVPKTSDTLIMIQS